MTAATATTDTAAKPNRRATAKPAPRAATRSGGKAVPSTRDRVLETCRRLFNERGPVAVTTAELAASAGINEGNLYYYFKTKEQMLLALFERFEQELAALHEDAARRSAGGDPDSYGAGLEAFFDLVWSWRYLYRDGLAIMALAPGLQQRISTHAQATLQELEREVRDMNARGRLAVPEAHIEALARNAWIVCTYWFQYLQYGQGVKRVTRAHIMQGCDQVRALYLPYVPRAVQG
jgi:AcrR family transcriptional regulator